MAVPLSDVSAVDHHRAIRAVPQHVQLPWAEPRAQRGLAGFLPGGFDARFGGAHHHGGAGADRHVGAEHARAGGQHLEQHGNLFGGAASALSRQLSDYAGLCAVAPYLVAADSDKLHLRALLRTDHAGGGSVFAVAFWRNI